ncbi:MAG: helix-turn-helix domain-containing protein [Lysobacterales bacterium]
MKKSLFNQLMQSVEQMDDIVRGQRPRSRVFRVDADQVKNIRKATGLSQARFAAVLRVEISTLQNWEQGRRQPSGPAKALLRALKNDPVNVLKAVG